MNPELKSSNYEFVSSLNGLQLSHLNLCCYATLFSLTIKMNRSVTEIYCVCFPFPP